MSVVADSATHCASKTSAVHFPYREVFLWLADPQALVEETFVSMDVLGAIDVPDERLKLPFVITVIEGKSYNP